MTQELKDFGNYLKELRLEKNLTLKDVEGIISVRENYLKAIEEGIINQCITPVYAYGFIQQYAHFLGVNFEKVLEENPRLLELSSHQHEFSYGIGTLEYRNSQGNTGGKKSSTLFWISLAILGIIGSWLLLKYLEVL